MPTFPAVIGVLLGAALLVYGFTGKPNSHGILVVAGMIIIALAVVLGLKGYADARTGGRAEH